MKKNKNILIALIILFAMVIVIPFMASCGKSGTVSPSASNIQLQIVNASPDVLPVNLYINFTLQNTAPYTYPNASGYVTPATIDTPIQIRTTLVSGATLFYLDSLLKPNTRHTLFVTGLRIDNSISYIFTSDTAAVPTLGRGKVRFVNASPRTLGLDVYANGTKAFANSTYKSVSKYIELPAGNYDFQVYATGGTTASVLTDLPGVTIQDGRLYTLYTRGLVGRTDTAAFGAAVLINR